MNSRLVKYGLGISIVCLGGVIWMDKSIQRQLRNQEYYTNPVIMLQKYKPASEIFGQPILSGRLHVGGGTDMYVTPLSAKICIPISGPKEKGSLYVIASRNDVNQSWIIEQLDLEISRSKQRWKFYDHNLASPSHDSNPTTESFES